MRASHRFETLQHASRSIGDWIAFFYIYRRPHRTLKHEDIRRGLCLSILTRAGCAGSLHELTSHLSAGTSRSPTRPSRGVDRKPSLRNERRLRRGAPAVASWGQGRLDIFARGLDAAAWHKAWASAWHPSPVAWEALGGGFTASLAVSAWGPDRLDIFGIGTDQGMWHKAWAQAWHPSQAGWENLGGKFTSPPAVASWGPDRLDIQPDKIISLVRTQSLLELHPAEYPVLTTPAVLERNPELVLIITQTQTGPGLQQLMMRGIIVDINLLLCLPEPELIPANLTQPGQLIQYCRVMDFELRFSLDTHLPW